MLANIEFIVCFSFVLYLDEFREEHVVDPSKRYWPEWAYYLCLGGLTLFIVVANWFGAVSTILSAKRYMYRIFFFLRFLGECFKIYCVLALWIDSPIFFNIVHFDLQSNNKYEFIITLTGFLGLTIVTFCWSIYRMILALRSRRRNQSTQVKAMWRVETQNFNPLGGR